MSLEANLIFDTVRRSSEVFVLPDSDDGPTYLVEPRVGVSVPRDVRIDLGPPPGGVVLRAGAVNRTTMPEATIEEDRDPRRRKRDVDCSATPFKHSYMDPEPQTTFVE